jgi:wyosine [tRNA(Phe)-imidazoG37] synthetase (radical SAM superfamily)
MSSADDKRFRTVDKPHATRESASILTELGKFCEFKLDVEVDIR